MGLAADSRDVKDGYLFAALAGENADGAEFIPDAEKKGAAAVLASKAGLSKLPTIVDKEPRKRLAKLAARFYGAQPRVCAGVTGTNGKTSTAVFAAQIWRALGESAASIGTLGASSGDINIPVRHTTPEPITLHKALAALAENGVEYAALEVSSHGLQQYRADGVQIKVAAFTNITHDHLDYHDDFTAYRNAKARLFESLLMEDGAAVINADGAGAEYFKQIANDRGVAIITTGVRGKTLRLVHVTPEAEGLRIEIKCDSESFRVRTPLIGAFQAENALVAAGIVMASGYSADIVLPALNAIQSAPGRMERVASVRGGTVFVDYAHTPDAVATALKALRPHVQGKLIAVIGAGGDRDKKKRPLMGAAAAANADIVIVTDDNPRRENPAAIRRSVLAGAPDALEEGDRKRAILAGIENIRPGDALLIAGKGHEHGQEVGDEILPFDDAQVVRELIAQYGGA